MSQVDKEEILREIDSAVIVLATELKRVRATLNVSLGIVDETNILLPAHLQALVVSGQEQVRAHFQNIPIATGTNFFNQDIKPLRTTGAVQLRIFITLDTTSTITVRKSSPSFPTGSPRVLTIATLTAGEANLFDIILNEPEAFNMRHSNAGTITITDLVIIELPKMI